MEAVEFKPKMDIPAKIILGLSAFVPFFLLMSGFLSMNWILISVSLLLVVVSVTFITWPFLNASYIITDDELYIIYFKPIGINIGSIHGVEEVLGTHKYAITGFGYYCVNFKKRILITAKIDGKIKEFVVSPPDPNKFMQLLGGQRSIKRRIEERKDEKKPEPKKEVKKPEPKKEVKKPEPKKKLGPILPRPEKKKETKKKEELEVREIKEEEPKEEDEDTGVKGLSINMLDSNK